MLHITHLPSLEAKLKCFALSHQAFQELKNENQILNLTFPWDFPMNWLFKNYTSGCYDDLTFF